MHSSPCPLPDVVLIESVLLFVLSVRQESEGEFYSLVTCPAKFAKLNVQLRAKFVKTVDALPA